MNTTKMKKNIFYLLFFATLGTLFYSPFLPLVSEAAFNEVINYQGKLSGSNNQLVPNGTYSIDFRLYNSPSAGGGGLCTLPNCLWSETRSVVITNGLFSEMLGTINSLSAVNFNQPLYLGIKVGTDPEMTPRKTIGAVPHAMNATKLDGLDSLDFVTTANNGITLLTSNVELGGPLVKDTFFDNPTFNIAFGSLNTFSGTNTFVVGESNTVDTIKSTIFGRNNSAISGNDLFIAGKDLTITGTSNSMLTGENSIIDTVSNSFISIYDSSQALSTIDSYVLAHASSLIDHVANSNLFVTSSTIIDATAVNIIGKKNNFNTTTEVNVFGANNTSTAVATTKGSIVGGNNSVISATPVVEFGLFGNNNTLSATSNAFTLGSNLVQDTNDSVMIGTLDSRKVTIENSGRVIINGAFSPGASDGISGQVLTSTGTGSIPVWSSLSGLLPSTSLNGLAFTSSPNQSFATATTGIDFTITSSGSTHTFNLPSASDTARGLVSLTTQTFAGAKTFVDNVTVGNASTDLLTINSSTSFLAPIQNTLAFSFDGATLGDGITTTLSVTNPTSNRIITMPNTSGTILLDTTGFANGGNSFGALATLGTNDANSLSFETSGTERMRITGTGFIGINDSTPDGLFDIDSAATTGVNFGITNTGVYTGTGLFDITANAATSGTLASISGTGLIAGTSALLISSGAGNSIGSPAAIPLVIKSGTTGAVTFDSGTTGAVNIGTGASAKNVTLGNTTAGSTTNILFPVGGGRISAGSAAAAGNLPICRSAAGVLFLGASATTCTPSLLSTKKDIQTLESSYMGLSLIRELNPVSYKYISNEQSSLGFIAEEATIIDSRFGAYNAEGNLTGLDYDLFVPVLTTGLQELDTKLNSGFEKISNEKQQEFLNTTTILDYINTITTETPRDVLTFFENKMSNGYRTFSDFVGERVTALRGYFDELYTQRSHQKELCIGDQQSGETCITKDQLDALLNLQGTATSSTPSTYPPASGGSPLVCTDPQILNSTGDACVDTAIETITIDPVPPTDPEPSPDPVDPVI